MKNIKYIYKTLLVLLVIAACTEANDLEFLENVPPPSNVSASYDVSQDNTGTVTITPTAEGANSYKVHLGDGTAIPVDVAQGKSVEHMYTEGTFAVKIQAYNINGDTAEATQDLVVSFKAPENVVVTIENDASTSKQVNIKTTGDFATMFEFYSGETGVDQPAATANIGETINYQYAEAGDYEVKVIAKGAAIATTEYTESFTVTEILAPLTAAPSPRSRAAEDVISVFSDAYEGVTLNEKPTSWSATVFEETQIDGNDVWKLASLDFLGLVTNYDNGVDLSSMEKMHIDYWVPDGITNELSVKLVNTIDGGVTEDVESLGTTVTGTWQSIEIDMTLFDDGPLANREKITQLILDSDGMAGIVYVDNWYFYKEPTVSDGPEPLSFEGGYTFSSFDGGDITVVPNPDTIGNSSAKVAKMVKNAGATHAGSKISLPAPFSFENETMVKMMVWSPRVGLELSVKFENNGVWPDVVGTDAITATTTVAGAWQELTFDFTGISTEIDFYNLILIMDNGTIGDGSENYTIYLDDVVTSPSIDFETKYTFSSFDGGNISVVSNPDTIGNNSASVAKMVKNSGATHAGSKITLPSPFSFENETKLKMMVWSPRVGLELSVKFENNGVWPDVVGTDAIIATTTVAEAWQELTFDFTGISTEIDFYNLVLIMDNGTSGDGSENYTIYLDDITQF